ncbi:MAG: hypothetical protein HOV97_05795 [Nonomuraea sp.]|nr:hypothetical protein [Nonomuraea sp.]
MQTEEGAKAIALTLGFLAGVHQELHKLRRGQTEEDERDIDSAQVFIEAAFEKIEGVLSRHEPTIEHPTKIPTESEED